MRLLPTYQKRTPTIIPLLTLFNNTNLGPKPFRLESFWCNHPDFVNVVDSSWNNNNIVTATSKFQEKVINWKNTTFGDIFKKKRKKKDPR